MSTVLAHARRSKAIRSKDVTGAVMPLVRYAALSTTHATEPAAEPASTNASTSPGALLYQSAGQDRNLSLRKWLNTKGAMYKEPLKGRPNWLGRVTPFPLNPSFKPPPPLSDALRSYIYEMHMLSPTQNTVAKLAGQWGISQKRVEAAIRLKAVEAQWKLEGRPLRTGFLKGMESCLGVPKFDPSIRKEDMTNLLPETHSADASAEEAVGPAKSDRGIARMYWEGVEAGKEPIVTRLLADLSAREAHDTAVATAKKTQYAASHRKVVPSAVEGRKAFTFVDIGRRFVDRQTQQDRIKAAKTRSSVKAKSKTKAATLAQVMV